jgi:hypothetical protein
VKAFLFHARKALPFAQLLSGSGIYQGSYVSNLWKDFQSCFRYKFTSKLPGIVG